MGCLGSIAAIALWVIAWALAPGLFNTALWLAGFVALICLLPMTLLQVHQGRLRGDMRPGVGLIPLAIVQPTLFLALLVGLTYWADVPTTGNMALVILGATFLATWIGVALTSLSGNPSPSAALVNTERQGQETRRWFIESLPFVAISGLTTLILQSDVLMIGALLGEHATGLYQPATRVAMLVSFALAIVNQPLGPIISRSCAENRKDQLQRQIDSIAVLVSAIAILLSTFFLVFGSSVLGVFGHVYKAGDKALAILVIGQCANAIFGPCGQLLAMTGHQRVLAQLLAIAAGVNVISNLVLIPTFGMEGAAAATSITLILWNSAVAVAAVRLVGVRSTPLLRCLYSR